MTADKQIGDAVVINYGHSGLLRNCFIHAIHFSDRKVKYDIKIFPFLEDEEHEDYFQILTGIDSFFVERPTDRFTGETRMPFIID